MKTILMAIFLALVIIAPAQAAPISPVEEEKCLAETMYYEARSEGVSGMFAVGQVVMNRTKDRRWPSSICKVVYQPYQFEWTRKVKNTKFKKDKKEWKQAQQLAKLLVKPNRYPNNNATHFVNKSQHRKSKWSRALTVVDNTHRLVFYAYPPKVTDTPMLALAGDPPVTTLVSPNRDPAYDYNGYRLASEGSRGSALGIGMP